MQTVVALRRRSVRKKDRVKVYIAHFQVSIAKIQFLCNSCDSDSLNLISTLSSSPVPVLRSSSSRHSGAVVPVCRLACGFPAAPGSGGGCTGLPTGITFPGALGSGGRPGLPSGMACPRAPSTLIWGSNDPREVPGGACVPPGAATTLLLLEARAVCLIGTAALHMEGRGNASKHWRSLSRYQ